MMREGNFTTYIEFDEEELEVDVYYEFYPAEESTNSPSEIHIISVEMVEDGAELADEIDSHTVENLTEQAYNYLED